MILNYLKKRNKNFPLIMDFLPLIRYKGGAVNNNDNSQRRSI
jgi:hypothetical protein